MIGLFSWVSLSLAEPGLVLVHDPTEVRPRQRRRLEARLGEVRLAPLRGMWQRGRLPRSAPRGAGPCTEALLAVHQLGPILEPNQRPALLDALVEASTCVQEHRLVTEPWLSQGSDPWGLRAAELLARAPDLALALDDRDREAVQGQRWDLRQIRISWEPGGPALLLDGTPVVPVDGEIWIPQCSVDLSWSSVAIGPDGEAVEIPGGSEWIFFERGTHWFPLEVGEGRGRALVAQLRDGPLDPEHLAHAAVYHGLVGPFSVASFDRRIRLWTFDGEGFEVWTRRSTHGQGPLR